MASNYPIIYVFHVQIIVRNVPMQFVSIASLDMGSILMGDVILVMLINVFSAPRIFIRVRGVRSVLELKIRNVWHVLITVTAHTTAIHVIYAS